MCFCYAVIVSNVEVDRTDETSCTSLSRLWLLDWTRLCILLTVVCVGRTAYQYCDSVVSLCQAV